MMILKPHKAAGSIAFGMNLQEVQETLGEPKLAVKNRRGEAILHYDGLHITLSNQGVVEVELLPENIISLEGVNIFSDPYALEKLCSIDGNAQQCLGAIILMNLGISLTGLHNRDESQKSATMFAEGRFDILKPQMTTFSDFAT